MTITYHEDLIQGSDEWLEARLGLLTASEMKLIITPTLKMASNDKERQHVFELLSQRLTGYVEPHYVSDDMLRGQEEEILARYTYSENYAPVTEVGFVTNDKFGFTIGYSPDGLIGEDGLLECKSRRAKYQVETILTHAVPDEYVLQLQTGLLVTERKWIDFVSYSGGLPMVTIRVFPDPKIQGAIVEAATAFEARVAERHSQWTALMSDGARRLIPTARRVEMEITL